MRRIAWNTRLLTAVAIAAVVPLACSGAGNNSSSSNTSGTGAHTGTGGTGGSSSSSGGGGDDCFPNCSDAGPAVFEVVPPSVDIDVVNGTALPFDFDATL